MVVTGWIEAFLHSDTELNYCSSYLSTHEYFLKDIGVIDLLLVAIFLQLSSPDHGRVAGNIRRKHTICGQNMTSETEANMAYQN